MAFGFAALRSRGTDGTFTGDISENPLREATNRILSIENRTLGQSSYNFKYRSFPSDLGSSYSKDYMIININVPTFRTSGFIGTNFRTSILPGESSTVDRVRRSSIPNAPTAIGGDALSSVYTRGTTRIAESIALFMPPGGLVYTYKNLYEEISMTALGGKVIAGAASLAAGALGGSLRRAVSTGTSVYGISNSAGRPVSQAALISGFPINPRVEVLFSHNELRQFKFEFLMSPRNETESQTIEEIIKTLRFHSVPELGAPVGFTYIPPAEFDISFYHDGKENTKIPRINTCVLTIIEVQYDPADGIFSTFRDGSPVAVRMTLGFQEVEPLHKARVNQGF